MDNPTPLPDTPLKQQAVTECRRDRRGDLLSYAIVAMLFYTVTLVFTVVILGVKIDPVVLTLVSVVVTCVVGTVGIVYGFQFGSSQGSQTKPEPPHADQPKEPNS